MSKKNKKFKKHTHKHSSSQVQSTGLKLETRSSELETENLESDVQESSSEIRKSNSPLPVADPEIAILDERYTYVRRDVRKLMIVLAVLIVLFVATYFLNTKTTVLDNFGDWIYKVGHFSI
ncbi:hypothetical protein COT78_03235 [Candidatus Berkelbacteria bacterium CG10_big_fil_rev_8_21_14_0_10_43_13]|uniref:Uncharacterized protein n=1 Tax=Candidatus Berkelbacteria bacterium CG10_big_fil_rev_8_21_14_0_10_43_13 TaxID=1974514 RepID=A0A2H0W619_9BACT|nr:MAG: hypothetical protein COT78_03235 [Candidatus Berkelbacteria bacterium CG10_big_fil_rev_8_21_14_0_10_43_13]